MAVTNSTLSGNTGTDAGCGIENAGALTMTDSTLSSNGSSDKGGGIYNAGTVHLGGTIMAKGTSGVDCFGSVNDEGYNIADDASCSFTATDSTNSSPTLDASLGALADNGGPTQTILPMAGSPTIGQVPPGSTLNGVQVCPSADQRADPRPGAGETDCTIGATEYGAIPPADTPEVSMPLLLPLSVLALGAAGYGVKRRRGRRPARQLSS